MEHSNKSQYVKPLLDIVFDFSTYVEPLCVESSAPQPTEPIEAKKQNFNDWSDKEGESSSVTSTPTPSGSINENPGNFHYFTGHLWND